MNYIQTMRKMIGHAPLLTVGCGVIIERGNQILLQHRTDADVWCIPGGVMELGEKVEDAARRETEEETGLTIGDLEFFGIYSGQEGFAKYASGDEVYSIQIIFKTSTFSGELLQKSDESRAHTFFDKHDLPDNLNSHQSRFIMDWVQQMPLPIIK
ncbi:NUDIX hydrolase [Paenisporosarcina quisquiliarum]|uniref:NUDIX hydrolase n=1 Tax=Paenisporosarcina quisquiliarum TaxID=365346 RepID=A0A9X3LF17_9BACL|nr:NUDIX hydrolase [Paenisporosarcina quisquiliarum]